MLALTENRLDWALAACGRVMRPVVRLALAMGLKHADLDGLLRDLLLNEARRSWRAKGAEPNISQLSVTTGLNRKAVTARLRQEGDLMPRSESSAAARTLTLWLEIVSTQPQHALLPVVADGEAMSFEWLARRASRGNVHHRTILEELVRLDMAVEREGHVELKADAFVPAGNVRTMLTFLGDNARDHLLAGVSNTLGEQPRLLERAVFAKGLTLEEAERIHQLVRERWGVLHDELAREMRHAVDEAGGTAKGRIRVGIYTYYEDEANGSRPSVGKRRALPGSKP
jgi:hypothetical protein